VRSGEKEKERYEGESMEVCGRKKGFLGYRGVQRRPEEKRG